MHPEEGEIPFQIRRLSIIMEPSPIREDEAWGVLNPACARSPRGELFLFPRIVGPNNYSRIGIARVLFDASDNPYGVERLGYALEPAAWYEQNQQTAGCEDPRVTYIAELSMFFMTYTAYGPTGPRIALAVSDDLLEWERVGLVQLERVRGGDFSAYDNKDALIFPELVSDPQGKPALALIHRPTYQYYWVGASVLDMVPQGVDDARPSMWLSYCSIEQLDHGLKRPVRFSSHRLLAAPDASWQTLKVGGGTPPIRTRHGWLTLFHGVSGRMVDGTALQPFVRYAAGALVLAIDDPSTVVFRTKDPILEPLTRQERDGIVPNVVFPTGIDQRGEGIVDVYYGMADARIGVGRLRVPDILPVTTGSLPQAEEAIA